MSDIDPQLKLFRRQYLQLFQPEFLAWPHPQLLRRGDVQDWIFKNLFEEADEKQKNSDNDKARRRHLPPERYQLRVLRSLVARIEKAIQDPEEDEISDSLMTRLGTLMTNGVPSEFDTNKEPAHVTFTCLTPPSPPNTNHNHNHDDDEKEEERTITLLEKRNQISGSRTTGHRTWEAALHLGTYLLLLSSSQNAQNSNLSSQNPNPNPNHLVRGKSILELGAGTGFLSILSAKHLHAKRVLATDGDENVVEGLRANFHLNGLDDEEKVKAERLWWGEEEEMKMEMEEEKKEKDWDLVIGADITYDKVAIVALVKTLGNLFRMSKEKGKDLQVLISGVVRNLDTFKSFEDECGRANFTVEEIDFPVKSMREQTALFYAAAVPIKILSITSP
ncbi:S-adenosyl-L-methionine-dependent methyltransferase [Poronia punctata]|nr:S-adenosyl-L-methionine-dependent methyltransferase [Poronia punctata]